MADAVYADAHCHLAAFENPSGEISRAIEAGVSIMICSGDSINESEACIRLSDSKYVFATVGISPEFAKAEGALVSKIEGLAYSNKGKVVGIGEIGLDKKETLKNEISVQEDAFASQIMLAKEAKLPIVIHSRGMLQRVVEIVKGYGVERAMFHFFEGTAGEAMELAKRYMISIPPNVNKERKRIISSLDIDNIVAETDSPFAGKSPTDVIRVIEEIAKIKGISVDNAADKITQNIRNLFNI
ncbi:MAG: TatD family hydrolase [Candidatus Micrarchaeia archaeon]